MGKRLNKRKKINESNSGDDASGDDASEEKRVPDPSDAPPTHREDFMRLLRAAAKRRERED